MQNITLKQLKEKAERQWQLINELIEYKRGLLDAGKYEQAKSLQSSIDYENVRWSMLDDLIEELTK